MCRRRDGQARRLSAPGFIAQPCGTTRRLANLRDVPVSVLRKPWRRRASREESGSNGRCRTSGAPGRRVQLASFCSWPTGHRLTLTRPTIASGHDSGPRRDGHGLDDARTIGFINAIMTRPPSRVHISFVRFGTRVTPCRWKDIFSLSYSRVPSCIIM